MIGIGMIQDVKRFFLGNTSVSQVFFQGEKVWPSTESGYLIFRAQGSAPITVGLASRSSVQTTLEYSSDFGATWNNMTTADSFTVSTTGTTDVWVRGKQTGNQSDSNFTQFTTSGTGRMRLVGNMNALWACDDITGENIRSYCAYRMFEGCANIRSLSNLTMPSTQLANSCYMRTFRDCTDLSAVPAGLLPATTLATASYRGLFYGCTSLTSGPELPATELGSYCYREMFYGCTALATAPELPATTLASNCYDRMFRACTSLTYAPELPAPILATSCYDSMFRDCTSLNYIKCLATDISASNCTSNWVNNVAPTGTFAKDENMQSWPVNSVNGIPVGWTVDEPPTNAIRLKSTGSNAITVKQRNNSNQMLLEYSTNGGSTWSDFAEGATVNLSDGQSLLIRGMYADTYSSGHNTMFSMTGSGSLKLDGTLAALIDYSDPDDAYIDNNAFRGMFIGYDESTGTPGTVLKDASGLIMPSQNLHAYSCAYMFRGNAGLLYAPTELPSLSIEKGTYSFMFQSCTSLVTAPKIYAPVIDELSCYEMLSNCTSLVTGPEMLCTTIKENGCLYMLHGCTNLNYVKCLATNISATDCTKEWLDGVAPTGTFVKAASATWPTGVSGIPSGWTVQNA